jgi:VWFA-related protein
VFALASTIADAQEASNATPTLRTSVHLVQINVIVHDKNGSVSDLAKSDFAVLDQGKPENIDVFSVESTRTAASATLALEPGTFSNVPRYGSSSPTSMTVVLLDNLNTLSGAGSGPYETTPTWLEDHALTNAKEHLTEFIKRLGPTDRVAIYSLGDSLRVLCDFTSDREQLLGILAKYDSSSRTQREVAQPGELHPPTRPEFTAAANASAQLNAAIVNQNRALTTMDALLAISRHVTDIPGRKNLVWLTADVPLSVAAVASALSRAGIAAYPVDARGLLPFAPAQEDADTAAVTQVFSRATAGLAGSSSQRTGSQLPGVDAMLEIADETGGRAFANTNDITGAIRQAVEDSAVSYTLGFYVKSASLDGKLHEIKVKVKRPGLNVRYPKEYFAYKDAPASNDLNRNNLITAVRSPLESSAIPVFVRIERTNQPNPNGLRVVADIDIRNVQLVQESNLRKGSVAIDIVQQDTSGKILDESAGKLVLQLTERQYVDYLRSGILFERLVDCKPGLTTLRLVVEDPSTGETGSVIIPLSEIK